MEVFLGSLMCVAFDFAPKYYALCNGQLLAIAQNQALFSLLGTQFGGDGRTTFGLPDLRGRVPVGGGQGLGLQNYVVGAAGGEESHTLITGEMPQHNHTWLATSNTGSINTGNGAVMGGYPMYFTGNAPSTVGMSPSELSNAGNGQPHENRQPILTMNWIIATSGIFPSRS